VSLIVCHGKGIIKNEKTALAGGFFEGSQELALF